MKQCTKCKRHKPLAEFNWKHKARQVRQPQCRLCTREGKKAHYRKNASKICNENSQRKQQIAEQFRSYKQTLSCVKCGEDTPECIDFHHVNPSTKSFAVAEKVGQGTSWKRLKQEIDKCIPVCKNCHVKIHLKLL